MAQRNLVYILSHVHKSLGFEWVTMGLMRDYHLTFILLNESTSSLEDFLVKQGVEVKRVYYRGKQDFFNAFLKTLLYFLRKRPDIVHAHLLDAQLIGLTAAFFSGVKKRIYTRHNSNYHHVYHPRGVWFDKWSNLLSTNIISISQSTDKTLLQLERVSQSKIVKIPHGFDLSAFDTIAPDRIEKICLKWKIPNQQPVVGVVARHIEWKGIQYIIPAFRKFLNENPSACLVLANAVGPYHEQLMELAQSIPTNQLVIIPFEEDIAALYAVFDLYVHTPIDPLCEAFGQTYIEALACGVPSIFTLSGIASEFIINRENALVVEFKNTEAIFEAMLQLWPDNQLNHKIVEKGRHDVVLRFGINPMVASLKALYDK